MWKTHTFVETKVQDVEKHVGFFSEGVVGTELVSKTLKQAESLLPGCGPSAELEAEPGGKPEEGPQRVTGGRRKC